MKKFILTICAVMLVSMPVMAKDISVDVNGLVCDFCAQAVKKVIGKQDGVTNVDVDLVAKKIVISLDDNTELDDEKITSLITDSGYDLVAINR